MKNIQSAFTLLMTHCKRIGRDGVRSALILWFAFQSDKTPLWAKSIILTALVYLVTPFDAIPDLIPGGFTDDMAVILAAALQIAASIDPECEARADRVVSEWFSS